MLNPKTVREVREIASANLTDNARLYYESGADGEQTLSENCRAYDRLRLCRSLPLHDDKIDLSTDLLGRKIDIPICISPTAMHRMAHDDGEIATAQAAKDFGTCMCVSILGTTCYEAIANNVPNGYYLMQLSIYNDREMTRDMIKTAENAGYEAIVLTVDTPVLGQRIADEKYKMKLPEHLSLQNFRRRLPNKLSNDSGSALAKFINENKERCLKWEIIDWVKSVTKLPLLLKGILTHEDAELCLKHNVDGILVSNHGARNLDSVPATIEALPEVVRAIRGTIPVFVDGGIRRGSDVFKALALGAKAVFIGRPVLYGLAYNGAEGVKEVLKILTNELTQTMKTSGCRSIKEIDSSMVIHESSLGIHTSSLTESSNWKPTADIIKCVADIKESAISKAKQQESPSILFSDDTFIFQRFRIRPRMLRGNQKINTSLNLFGIKSSLPVVVGINDATTFLDSTILSKVLKESGLVSVESVIPTEIYQSLSNFIEINNRELNDGFLNKLEKGGCEGVIVVNDGSVIKEAVINTSKVPVLIKKIFTKQDAISCLKLNIHGIVVCGDSTMSAVDILEEVVDAVNGRIPVIYEGSVTKGGDIFKAIGLGAKAVLVNEPFLWGAMHKGIQGVEQVLKILKDELIRAMHLSGAGTLDEITRSMVVRESYYWNVGRSVSRL